MTKSSPEAGSRKSQRSKTISKPVTQKCKTKPQQPISKYRRKNANARERTRMQEINSAFELLRNSVPKTIDQATDKSQSNDKNTKITTLRLAMNYINFLSSVLISSDTHSNSSPTTEQSPLLSLTSTMETSPVSPIHQPSYPVSNSSLEFKFLFESEYNISSFSYLSPLDAYDDMCHPFNDLLHNDLLI